MKKLSSHLFVFLILSLCAWSQTNINAEGGILSSTGTILSLPNSTVIAVITTTEVTGNLGNLSLVLPDFASGDLQDGGVLDAGGTLTVTAPGQSINYVATFAAGAQWMKLTRANGTHLYLLQNAHLVSSQGNGAMVLQTANVGTGLWPGSAAVSSIGMAVTFTSSVSRRVKPY